MSMPNVGTLLKSIEESHRYQYDCELVSEREHALQCAELACNEGGDDELVAAALLHDIGRFAVRQSGVKDTLDPKSMRNTTPGASGHDQAGADLLQSLFPERVVFCVRMHVASKRYLCTTDPSYLSVISGTSIKTLEVQGGKMNSQELKVFQSHPWFENALSLRRWDDRAKKPDCPTRPVSYWRPLLETLAVDGKAVKQRTNAS